MNMRIFMESHVLGQRRQKVYVMSIADYPILNIGIKTSMIIGSMNGGNTIQLLQIFLNKI